MTGIPTKEDIENASQRIGNYIHRTPILTSESINRMFNTSLFFKCENFQKTGAFKMRGATNAIMLLQKDKLKNGVATHSSGNHAGALAYAAQRQNIPSYIVMPRTAPKVKISAVKSYGGIITFCEPTLKAREETLEKVVAETTANFIHPYDNYNIISGQATSAKEIFEDLTDLDFIITPVGGGGLLSGTILSAKYFSPSTKVIAAEPKGADDAFRSVRDNKIYPSVNPNTIADGLLTSLSEKTFTIIRNGVERIITVTESGIKDAMLLIWERMKIIVEPSSATVLAAIMENPELFMNKRIALILSGGNIAPKFVA